MATLARSRIFTLGNLRLETPVFMPVGTRATVRGQELDDLEALDFPVLLANTYHLGQRPGPEVLNAAGGVKKWMDWKGAVLTDSGGYQVFSLSEFCKIEESGAVFKSFLDGKKVHLTPELSLAWQAAIGSDIRMVFDQCVPSTVDHATAKAAMELTHRWANRSIQAHGQSNDGSSLFGIVQGACFEDLRRQSAEYLSSLPFRGLAIGGLAVGESKSQREDITELTTPLLPADKPRYLMGVGTPLDILEAVHRGVDMFDCILPTAIAQHGVAYTSRGKIDLKRGSYRLAQGPLDPECGCRTCRRFPRSYLHHLVRVGECMGWQHIAHHNFNFYRRIVEGMRTSIKAGVFEAFYSQWRAVLGEVDLENPSNIPAPRKHHGPSLHSPSGLFDLVQNAKSEWSVRGVESGEVMHPGLVGLLEAEKLYVEQPQLKNLCESETETSPIVIWDVGLGMAANAMAAIRCWENSAARRDLEIVSFDTTLEPLELVVRHQRRFQHVWHGAPKKLLADRSVDQKHPTTEAHLRWTFHEGTYLDFIDEVAKPRLIFYDPFSPKSNPALWTVTVFSRLRRLVESVECELITYSASTSVRTSLLLGGFYVGRGDETGKKLETTVAVTGKLRSALVQRERLLDDAWIVRWEKSSAFAPPMSTLTRDEIGNRLRAHPQFQPKARTGADPLRQELVLG